ncbi:MarR family winged helix-turn-helix transcriptional regulator [Luteipulveratus mongoliensis]|uniref:HTH marR-type domain-containing protein n=1 Tax=Luteipulveratus mongoliensis TaxID=571913 RepID=A0A0K1JMJ5_9MICO|nr:MarR family transcriptional regulator [Luteipulveratus mongoliensis]AKU17936.1 hypothetical protein VV02_22185 [Luteipulveratus mongoliensis]
MSVPESLRPVPQYELPEALRHLDPMRRYFLDLHEVPPSTNLVLLLRRALTTLEEAVVNFVRLRGEEDVSKGDIELVRCLSAGSMPVAAVAEHLRLSHQAAARRVSDLADRGIVMKNASYHDARVALICLTRDGRALHESASKALEDVLEILCADLLPEHVDSLLVALAVLGQIRPDLTEGDAAKG